jgi:hypothetical protein
VEAQGDEPERDDAQHNAPERLAKQEKERAPKALDLARVVVHTGLDEEPTDDQKDDAAGEHPEAAEFDRYVPF